MFRNIFRGSQRAITTLARPSPTRQTPMLCREALIRHPKQIQRQYTAFRPLACTRQYSSQRKVTVNSGSDANGGNGANNKSDSTTKRGIICRVAARAERKKHLALICRALREISEKLDKIEMNWDKTQKQKRYMFWKLVLATIVIAVVGAMVDPKKPKKQENETAGEISPDTSPISKENPDIVS
ncbi:hypothetical protein GCG54_00009279 [Colletotrichum gloeosporioides]|uniref:Uncharacterized protein n=1 Tax=Colletotrichum gloeosporioides TaxID=474922 RepID=A0A8H4C470_COLGL|nr:uncharacterized protein GCG54_00009279 [Colletotrichum gloeosporioides]KAF3797308.1 hypothetical protein GCG54_00009279 [Colletotrichum gloeosporioides]